MSSPSLPASISPTRFTLDIDRTVNLSKEKLYGSGCGKAYRRWHRMHWHGRCRCGGRYYFWPLPRGRAAQSVRRAGAVRQPHLRLRGDGGSGYLLVADRLVAALYLLRTATRPRRILGW